MVIISSYLKLNFKLEKEEWKFLIDNSDLNTQNKNGINALMLVLMNNNRLGLNVDIDLFLEKTDMKKRTVSGISPLISALQFNDSEKLNLTKKQWNAIILNSDINSKDLDGWTALHYLLSNYHRQNLKLTNTQWSYIVDNTNFKEVDRNNKTVLNLFNELVDSNVLILEAEKVKIIKNKSINKIEKIRKEIKIDSINKNVLKS